MFTNPNLHGSQVLPNQLKKTETNPEPQQICA